MFAFFTKYSTIEKLDLCRNFLHQNFNVRNLPNFTKKSGVPQDTILNADDTKILSKTKWNELLKLMKEIYSVLDITKTDFLDLKDFDYHYLLIDVSPPSDCMKSTLTSELNDESSRNSSYH
ncbi:hypothetical protein BpHYR1_029160 [Brachionus plicatilis]|uniref:Uncharacterized protein n=1 Tax=Brachionus plicatilis TaxID=10195 RepID=A0A3M7SAD3_BRAPC|nr:hypothetical protein BpHYR1_029160 [Brachionus plicatilis]